VTNEPGLSEPTRRLHRLAKDFTGQKFGRLQALECVASGPVWLCRCECGGRREVRARQLRDGAVTCCGCLVPKRPAIVIEAASKVAPKPCSSCVHWAPLEGSDLGGWCKAERFMSGKPWTGRCPYQAKGGQA
jgi:hypothetical protein